MSELVKEACEVFKLKCDECNKRATTLARDAIEIPNDGQYLQFEGGPLRKGCEDHPVQPVYYMLNGSVKYEIP